MKTHSLTAIRSAIVATAMVPAAHATAGGGVTGEPLSVAGHIPRTMSDTPYPVTVIDRQEIELSGKRNVSDLLLSRVRFNSFGLHRPFVLGTGRASVLVNGRRISDSTFDLDTLPISAVERVEILSDSAAALHGGHAIGGAINIILRRDYEGVELQANAARPTRAGGDSEHGSALWGGALGRGHLTIGVDGFRREEIRDADRDYSRASWTPGGSFADTTGVSVGGNTVIIPTGDGSSIARPLGDCEGSAYVKGLTNPVNLPGTGCGFAFADIKWHQESLERGSVFLNADHPLGDGTDLYVDARAARGETTFRYAPSVGTFSFKPTAALREKLLRDPEIDALPETLRVAHRFAGHGNRDWWTDLEEYDLALGLRGRFRDDAGFDAHLRYHRYEALETGDTFVSQSLIQEVIAGGRYDVENPLNPDLNVYPGHWDAVRETGLRLAHDQVTEHKTARVSLDGTAFALGDNDLRWAVGGELADEDWRDVYDYRDVANRSHGAADVLGSAGSSASGERRRWSAFAEVSVPVLDAWDLVFAGRRDDHDDVGATSSHQIASRYRLNEALALRASWSEGSRAPSLEALHQLEALGYPSVCDTRTFTGNLEDCDETQVERVSGGNPDLKPDEAESVNVGAMASLGPFSLSLDWFRLTLSDVPSQLHPQLIVDLERDGKLGAFPGAGVIREGGVITRIESPLVNSGEADVEGLNMRAGAGWETDWAEWGLDARWSRLTRYESRVAGELQPGDYSRDRVHVSLHATRGDLTASWSVHALSGYWNVKRTTRYAGWAGHDLTLRWRDAFGFDGLDLTGGILNAGDRGPSTDPADPGLSGADVTLDSALGRTLFLSAGVSF